MTKPTKNLAQQLAEAASNFQKALTGRAPTAVTVVMSADTLVITLHGALSTAEQDLAKTTAGAEQVQQFHRQLFQTTANSLQREIHRITGVPVREAAAEVEPMSGAVGHAFTTGTMVQVFQLERKTPAEEWNEAEPKDYFQEETFGPG
jgi:uncharacterized protein YbcI